MLMSAYQYQVCMHILERVQLDYNIMEKRKRAMLVYTDLYFCTQSFL